MLFYFSFQCALKLLRAGAFVIITTRFPHDAALRYFQEKDYFEWKNRLHIYGLDLRDLACLEEFTNFLKQNYPKLDIIINNAAQTIRRPPTFYYPLLNTETKQLKDDKLLFEQLQVRKKQNIFI